MDQKHYVEIRVKKNKNCMILLLAYLTDLNLLTLS